MLCFDWPPRCQLRPRQCAFDSLACCGLLWLAVKSSQQPQQPECQKIVLSPGLSKQPLLWPCVHQASPYHPSLSGGGGPRPQLKPPPQHAGVGNDPPEALPLRLFPVMVGGGYRRERRLLEDHSRRGVGRVGREWGGGRGVGGKTAGRRRVGEGGGSGGGKAGGGGGGDAGVWGGAACLSSGEDSGGGLNAEGVEKWAAGGGGSGPQQRGRRRGGGRDGGGVGRGGAAEGAAGLRRGGKA